MSDVIPDELVFATGAAVMGLISCSIGRASQRGVQRLLEPQDETQVKNAAYFEGQVLATRLMTPGFFTLAIVLLAVGLVRLVV